MPGWDRTYQGHSAAKGPVGDQELLLSPRLSSSENSPSNRARAHLPNEKWQSIINKMNPFPLAKNESGFVTAAGRAKGLSIKHTLNVTCHEGQRQVSPEPRKHTPGSQFFFKRLVKAHVVCHTYKKLPDIFTFYFK